MKVIIPVSPQCGQNVKITGKKLEMCQKVFFMVIIETEVLKERCPQNLGPEHTSYHGMNLTQG